MVNEAVNAKHVTRIADTFERPVTGTTMLKRGRLQDGFTMGKCEGALFPGVEGVPTSNANTRTIYYVL